MICFKMSLHFCYDFFYGSICLISIGLCYVLVVSSLHLCYEFFPFLLFWRFFLRFLTIVFTFFNKNAMKNQTITKIIKSS